MYDFWDVTEDLEGLGEIVMYMFFLGTTFKSNVH